MDRLPPIPSPPGTVWREFRINALPYLTFLAVLAATVVTWRSYIGPSSVVGEVISVSAVVCSPQAGRVAQVRVGQLQWVAKGEPVVQILTTDPRILEAQLALSRARIDLVKADVDPKLRKENNRINYEQLRLDWRQRRVDLAMAKAKLGFYENEFVRVGQLFVGNTNNIASIRDFEVAKRDVESTRAEVMELERLVNDSAVSLSSLEPAESSFEDDIPGAVRSAIALEERELGLIEAQLAPITLVSPIDGIVSVVHHRNGESIVAGEPILTLRSSNADQIVAYIPQPLRREPQVGQKVEIRSRSFERSVGRGEIRAVGGSFEPVQSETQPIDRFDRLPKQTGLPILVGIPVGMKLLPGEFVDLELMQTVAPRDQSATVSRRRD